MPGKRLVAILATVLFVVVGFAGADRAEVVQSFEFSSGTGLVDYQRGFVEATAIGTVDMKRMVNSIQAEAVARRTARHLAYEVLAETVGQVRVDTGTIYLGFTARADALRVQTRAVIKGAMIVSDEVEWVLDRRTKEELPMGKVTLRLYLTGAGSLGELLDRHIPVGESFKESDHNPAPAAAPVITPVPAPKPAPVTKPVEIIEVKKTVPKKAEPVKAAPPKAAPPKPEPRPAVAPGPEFNVIVIDVRNTAPGYRPALRPSVLAADEALVYDAKMVDPASAIRYGYIRYAKKDEEVNKFFGEEANPLVIEAYKSPKPGMLRVTVEQAELVYEADANGEIRRKGRVVLLLE